MDPNVSKLIRQAAWRAGVAGFAVGVLLLTVMAVFVAGLAAEFRHGAAWGFAIGLGVVLGGTILNAAIGLIDQAKSDITGS